MEERFSRIKSLLGDDAFKKLESAKVAIVGLGGVGATAATALARSGLGNLIILDFDKVNESNINRQLLAFSSTLGKYKTDVLSDIIYDINPSCKVTKLTEKFNEESLLFNYEFDYLIDAIDSVNDKLLLIKKCQDNKKCFISSMGTAKKMDIKKLDIMKLSKTSYDPLAKVIRKKAKELNLKDFYCLASTEEPAEIDTLGSYMPVTSAAGLLLADYIIKMIIK